MTLELGHLEPFFGTAYDKSDNEVNVLFHAISI